MYRPAPPAVSPRDLLRTALRYPLRWLLPAGIISAAAFAYAVLHTRTWEATQTLLVRDEVTFNAAPGISSTRGEELKGAQETALELSHSHKVLRQALVEAGPPAGSSANYPTEKDIEELAERVSLTPPKGGEFGNSEIFYLKARNPDRERALKLAHALSVEIQNGYEELRRTKALSLLNELEKTAALAQHDLDEVTRQLSSMEREVGGTDLGELRILNDLPSGMSDLRNESLAIENELRKEFNERIQLEQLLIILNAAMVDEGELIACPNSLLTAQPGLKRLKDGLIDAQIKSATLLGTMSADHPQVRAAREVADQIGLGLHGELTIAIRAIEADLRLSSERIAKLESQKATLAQRLDKLADIRARYSNLAAMAKHRGEILKTAELELADARSRQAAAHAGALIQLIGEPVTGTRPMGPGRTVIVLAGCLGGMLVGLGLVVLTAKPAEVRVEETPMQGTRAEDAIAAAVAEAAAAKAELAATRAEAAREERVRRRKRQLERKATRRRRTSRAAKPAEAVAVMERPAAPTSTGNGGPLTLRQALERIVSQERS